MLTVGRTSLQKKSFKGNLRKIFVTFLAGILLSFLLIPAAAGAQVQAAGRTSWFDFSSQNLTCTAGDTVAITLNSQSDFVVYLAGNTSNDTVAKYTGKKGFSQVRFQIAPDEQSSQIVFAFYTVWQQDQAYDTVVVNVKKRQITAVPMTAVFAPFNDGSQGVAATFPGSEICLVSNNLNQPLAVFTISGKYGQEQMQLGDSVVISGITLLTVVTPNDLTAATIHIGDQDKANLAARGIWGLNLNGNTIFWP